MEIKYFVHPSAHISEGAVIGEGTQIWINAQIRESASIGRNCVISKDVYVGTEVKVGNGVKVQNSVSLYDGVVLEDDVFVGPNVTFTNDKVPRAFNNDWKTIPTIIRKGASLGANSTIVCGIEIGEYAMVGAGAVVTKTVEPYALVVGNPARVIGRVDIMGNKINDIEVTI